ncbi:MAG: hypothetical protein ABSC05_35925 [Candidatus Solibacter sp.]|jgi:hypothetical protein
MTPATEIRPALQGDPRDTAAWALEALAEVFDLTAAEVATVIAAIAYTAEAAQVEDATGHRCSRCGCSDARSCPNGCIWATATLCSRCVA